MQSTIVTAPTAERAFAAFAAERYTEIEAYLAARLDLDCPPRVVKDCIDWNGHLIKSRFDPDGERSPEHSGIVTYTENGFAAHLKAVFAAAAGSLSDDVDRALLCLWARQCFRKAWQHTYRFNRLRLTQTAFASAARGAWGIGPERRRGDPFLSFVLRYLDLLDLEIFAEDQLHTGSLPLQKAAVEAVLVQCADLTASAAALEDRTGLERAVVAHVETQTASRNRYNHALLASNQGVQAATEGDWPAVAAAIKTIARAARATPPDAFTELSEIGALGQSLQRFEEHRRVPWLCIDRGRIAYLYPFGITGIPYADLVNRLREHCDSGQVRPVAFHEHFTAHSDIWHPHARQDQRFDGIELSLPEVTLTVGEKVERLQASVRFTSLGMHCLRFERPVLGVRPHELNAILLRGLREHGTVQVTCEGTAPTWKRLSRLARTILNVDLPERLAAEEPVTIHRGRSHVLLRVQHASEYQPGRAGKSAPVRDGQRLLDLFGASGLLNAAPATKESAGDWARLSGRRRKVMRGLRNEGDVLISTENTTVIASLDTPSNLSAELEALADLTACIGGALGAWNQQLDDYQAMNTAIIDAYQDPGQKRRDLIAKLRAQRTHLTRFENETRRVISVLYSPNLLRSSAHAAVLRRLMENSGLDQQLQEFRERLTEVAADQTEANLQRWETERKQHSREAVTIALSALGICAAFQIWQAANVLNDMVWAVATAVVALGAMGYMSRRYLFWFRRGRAR
ncbi:hypothetical protein AB0B28_16035 [Glycomyces sp. NPDC046736]|uniref:hypothetical protein n=1 Tax=Glycomyces sp. NPDC046736 TaxID=3155615 RepID=UPI0033E76CB3